MATAQQTKHELSDEQMDALLDKAVTARERKERREKIKKAGGALDGDVTLWVNENAEGFHFPPHGPLCAGQDDPAPLLRSLERVRPVGPLFAYLDEGHPRLPPPWRKATPEEAVRPDVVTLQDQARLLEELQELAKPQEVEKQLEAEVSDKLEMRRMIDRRLAELEVERQKACAVTQAAKAQVDELFAGKSEAWRRNALAAVHVLHAAIVANIPDRRVRMDGVPIGAPPKKPAPLGKYDIGTTAPADSGDGAGETLR
jgi:hypothetical protein